jgi:hypothetical protein
VDAVAFSVYDELPCGMEREADLRARSGSATANRHHRQHATDHGKTAWQEKRE